LASFIMMSLATVSLSQAKRTWASRGRFEFLQDLGELGIPVIDSCGSRRHYVWNISLVRSYRDEKSMAMQGVSSGYLLSNLGTTQRYADQMVVVGKGEGKRPKFLPVIGLGQQAREDFTARLSGYRLTVYPGVIWAYLQDYIRKKNPTRPYKT
jgi:hypothetical protein